MVAHHGTLWIVKKNMIAKPNHEEVTGNRYVVIEKGEILEWRYESNNHFRTKDNLYFWVDDNIWNEHCLKIAKIDDKVHFNNKAELNDIWRLELFTWIENGKELYHTIKKELEK